MLNSAKAAQQAAVELQLVDARPLEDMDAYKERFGPVTPVLPTLLEANYALPMTTQTGRSSGPL